MDRVKRFFCFSSGESSFSSVSSVERTFYGPTDIDILSNRIPVLPPRRSKARISNARAPRPAEPSNHLPFRTPEAQHNAKRAGYASCQEQLDDLILDQRNPHKAAVEAVLQRGRATRNWDELIAWIEQDVSEAEGTVHEMQMRLLEKMAWEMYRQGQSWPIESLFLPQISYERESEKIPKTKNVKPKEAESYTRYYPNPSEFDDEEFAYSPTNHSQPLWSTEKFQKFQR